MHSRNSSAPIMVAGLLAVGLLGAAAGVDTASAGPALLSPGKSGSNHVVQIGKRGGDRLYVPIAPSYTYYDYPYYYSRGYYPTHIKPGFIYYGYPYAYYTSRYYRKYRAARAGRNVRY